MLIPLDQLEAHPANANVMPAKLLAKLEAHIREAGRCPPLIVRPLDDEGGERRRYQILDGHHRAMVLRRLGVSRAECDVWDDVDDARASILLLTMNRLHGEDDPQRRGALLADLSREQGLEIDALAKILPDDMARIEKLIKLASPVDGPAIVELTELPDPDSLPQAVTFFLTPPQRDAVLVRLRAIDRDRSAALVKALDVEARP